MKPETKPTSGKSGPRARSAATVRSVAREAGVSPATVSRIINGTVNVSEELRASVESAIAKLRFRPNAAARGLALGKSQTIGVITQSIDSPFYGEGLRGIERKLQANGYAPLFMSGNWQVEDEDRAIRELVARGVDGIIMFAGCIGDAALKEYAKRVPIVVTGRTLRGKGLLSLHVDDQRGADLAMQHLLGLGHRQIAFIGGSANHPDAVERLAGYRNALEQAGIRFDPRLVAEGDWHEAGGEAAVHQLLAVAPKLTAIFCVNDQTAYGACLGLFRKGLLVPRDVSVVGFDDLPSSTFRLPPLTSVRQSVLETGERAAEAMVQLIRGKRPKVELPPVGLVVRESTRHVDR